MNDLSTRKLAIGCFGAVILAAGMDALGSMLPFHYQGLRNFMEISSTIMAWTFYWLLVLLVPVSAFRPFNRFSMQGDCRARALVFTFSLSLVILGSLGAVLVVISAFSRGSGV